MSKLWEHYSIFTERHEKDGVIENQRWAKCSRCNYRARAEPRHGTSHLWHHLRNRHHYNHELNQFQDPQIGEGGANANADMGEVLNADNPWVYDHEAKSLAASTHAVKIGLVWCICIFILFVALLLVLKLWRSELVWCICIFILFVALLFKLNLERLWFAHIWHVYILLLLNIRVGICIRHSPNPIHTVFDTHYSYP
jgi:hypothetical protein